MPVVGQGCFRDSQNSLDSCHSSWLLTRARKDLSRKMYFGGNQPLPNDCIWGPAIEKRVVACSVLKRLNKDIYTTLLRLREQGKEGSRKNVSQTAERGMWKCHLLATAESSQPWTQKLQLPVLGLHKTAAVSNQSWMEEVLTRLYTSCCEFWDRGSHGLQLCTTGGPASPPQCELSQKEEEGAGLQCIEIRSICSCHGSRLHLNQPFPRCDKSCVRYGL